MPGYPGTALATLLRDNTQAYFFNNETPSAGELSIAFQLERVNRSFYPWGLSFELWFTQDPGTVEVDIMGANNDQEGHYVQLGSITTLNSSYCGRWDMSTNMWPKYVAAYVKTLTNSVPMWLQVTK